MVPHNWCSKHACRMLAWSLYVIFSVLNVHDALLCKVWVHVLHTHYTSVESDPTSFSLLPFSPYVLGPHDVGGIPDLLWAFHQVVCPNSKGRHSWIDVKQTYGSASLGSNWAVCIGLTFPQVKMTNSRKIGKITVWRHWRSTKSSQKIEGIQPLEEENCTEWDPYLYYFHPEGHL